MLNNWGYCEANGPTRWAESYPIAVTGRRQSPIDISTEACHSYFTKAPLVAKYPDSIYDWNLVNTGHGWKVDMSAETLKNTSLRGGPLNDKYVLEQFHCHWGKDCASGSEHTVDGKHYSAELHLVHWNSTQFSSFSEAASHANGLAVLGVFLEVGQQLHGEFEMIVSLVDVVQYKGQQVTVTLPLSIDYLLPKERAYWTYEGSLTTPPFYESVTWIVFKDPIVVSEGQIAMFRGICKLEENQIASGGPAQVVENFRPPQPLCSRAVYFVEPKGRNGVKFRPRTRCAPLCEELGH